VYDVLTLHLSNETVYDVLSSSTYLLGSNTFFVVDIADKNSLQIKGRYDLQTTYGWMNDVVVEGNFAYISHQVEGFLIIDISVKEDPSLKGQYYTKSLAFSVAVNGDYAYVIDKNDGLVIIDISDKADPQFQGHYNATDWTWEDATDVEVSGEYAYVADNYNGLVIINISDKANPQFKGHFNTSNMFTAGVAVSGDTVYLAAAGSGLVLINISDKENPRLKGHFNTSGGAGAVIVGDNYAYIADGYNGFVIVEVGNDESDGESYEWTKDDIQLNIKSKFKTENTIGKFITLL